MQYIDRELSVLFPQGLNQIMPADNDVRFIYLFAESINIADFKFVTKQSIEGRPAYTPKDLLKLFIYGYLNGIRSSRLLEKQCHINVEVMWLMKQLAPDHNTITISAGTTAGPYAKSFSTLWPLPKTSTSSAVN